VNSDVVAHSQRHIMAIADNTEVKEDKDHLDILQKLIFTIPKGRNVKLTPEQIQDFKSKIEDMIIELLKHEASGLGNRLKRKDLKTINIDKIDIDEAKRLE